jgi:hypothetical protein
MRADNDVGTRSQAGSSKHFSGLSDAEHAQYTASCQHAGTAACGNKSSYADDSPGDRST